MYFFCLKLNNSALKNFFLHEMFHISSVAEPHHFYAAPAPSKNFDVASAPFPTLMYSKPTFHKTNKG
jgi:hypothetical protein